VEHYLTKYIKFNVLSVATHIYQCLFPMRRCGMQLHEFVKYIDISYNAIHKAYTKELSVRQNACEQYPCE
jgi:hypothetical protein